MTTKMSKTLFDLPSEVRHMIYTYILADLDSVLIMWDKVPVIDDEVDMFIAAFFGSTKGALNKAFQIELATIILRRHTIAIDSEYFASDYPPKEKHLTLYRDLKMLFETEVRSVEIFLNPCFKDPSELDNGVRELQNIFHYCKNLRSLKHFELVVEGPLSRFYGGMIDCNCLLLFYISKLAILGSEVLYGMLDDGFKVYFDISVRPQDCNIVKLHLQEDMPFSKLFHWIERYKMMQEMPFPTSAGPGCSMCETVLRDLSTWEECDYEW